MIRVRMWAHWALGMVIGSGLAAASPLEEEFILNAGWCPGPACGAAGLNIQNEHQSWHMTEMMTPFPAGAAGKEFVEFHREFIAQCDDFRLYGADLAVGPDPDPAAVPVLAQPGSLLRFVHTNVNGFVRPAGTDIAADGTPWTPRPATLRLRNCAFHNFTANGVGASLNSLFHGNGHVSIGVHDELPGNPGDMLSTFLATRDSAFFQWHKNIDNIYADWAIGQYQLCANTGTPIYFSMNGAAVGRAGSSLNQRRQADAYQGNNPPGANQYGAIPRIASDIYVADTNATNLHYQYGIRQWNTLNAWDVDAWTILNPPGNGWYFSVTPASVGLAGTAVNAQAVRGGDVFESAGGGTNALYRVETIMGLLAAASDNLDALEVDQQKRVQATNDRNRLGIADRPKQWFSLRSGSTFGVQAFGGAVVGHNDILRYDSDGNLVIAVAAATLGLGAAANELDAMVIVDTPPLDALNATDRIYYSLAAGSPALGGNSPADIFCRQVNGTQCGPGGALVEMTAAALGLAATDDLDALDIKMNPTGNGACCHANGTCTEGPSSACTATGDIFWGPETVCSAAECPPAPGACCRADGSCSQLSDVVCALVGGTFQGVGVACPPTGCPSAPDNDTCEYGYEIPYNYRDFYGANGYYEPPAQYTDNTYATSNDPTCSDPPYGCADHEIFFPPYGSGTIWYTYDVPDYPYPRGPGAYTGSIGLYTSRTYDYYQPAGDYAGDTRLAIYYAPNGDCSYLQEVACGDNSYTSYDPPYPPNGGYGYVEYNDPPPGRYYIQVSTVGDVNRGYIYLQVRDPSPAACCLPNGSCANVPVSQCLAGGGEPGATGSACLGDADGNGIDDLCQNGPCDDCGPGPHWIDGCAAGADHIPTVAYVGIDLGPNGSVDTFVRMAGPSGVRRTGPLDDSVQFPGTRPNTPGHLDVIDTEMISLNLTGGGMTLTAGPSNPLLAASLGNMAERSNDPAKADSFFNIFFEVDMGGGNRLYNQTPCRVAAVVDCVPPQTIYFLPFSQRVQLHTSPTPGQGAHTADLVSAYHFTSPVFQACCNPDGTCSNNLDPADCVAAGGEPGGAGSTCQGDGNNNGIDDLCEDAPCADCGPGPHWIHDPSCSAGTDHIPTGAVVGLDLDLNCVEDTTLVLLGPSAVRRTGPLDDSNNTPGTRPVDGHLDVIDTEMLSLNLTGGGATLIAGAGRGAIPLAATLGNMAEQSGNPALADSYFDVFFEIDLGGGNRVYNQAALRVSAEIDCVPPRALYVHPNQCVGLYTSPTPGQGVRVANLTSANHSTFPPQACCYPDGTCANNIDPAACAAANGEAGGPNSLCHGDGDDNNIDDLCQNEPCDDCGPGPHWIDGCAAGSDHIPTVAYVGIDLGPNGSVDTFVRLTGPSGVRRTGPLDDSVQFPGTRPNTPGHLDVIDTEMISLNLTGAGMTLTAGPANPLLAASLGNMAERSNPALADSFFDIFFELDDGTGNKYYNHTPCRVSAVVDCVPPQKIYLLPFSQRVELFTQPVGGIHVADMVSAYHFTFPELQACCNPDGTCTNNIDPADCVAAGGQPGGADSTCQGDANGNGIDDLCDDDPCSDGGPGPHWVDATPAGADSMPTGALIGIDMNLDCVRDQNLVLFGPAVAQRNNPGDDSNQYPGTRPIDGHLDAIDTQLLSMSLTGGGATLTVGAGRGAIPLAATLGAIAEQPGSPTLADSFFDVFFEVDLGGGNRLYNQQPVRVQAVIDCVPPTRIYFHPIGICIPLYTSPTPGQGVLVANLVSASHDPFPMSGACCSGESCTTTTSVECGAQGGQFRGEGVSCTPNPCTGQFGACCGVVGGTTCQEDVSAQDCACLGEKFTENGSCASANCVATPTGCGCPPNHLFGPGYHDGIGCGTTADSFDYLVGDDASGTSLADAFWNLTQPIKFVQFAWAYSSIPFFGPCDKADEFVITFYDDDCGAPGGVAAGPFVVYALRSESGLIIDPGPRIFTMTAQLPVSVSMATGWVGIASRVDPYNQDCRGHGLIYADEGTAAGLTGDEKSWQLGFGPGLPAQLNGDLAYCLSAPSDPGACCDDLMATCTNNTPPSACPPPRHFAEGETCATLDPPCGQGACCTLDGNCAVTTQAGCTGTWRLGVACAFANCPPSNDNCAVVIPATGGLPYSFTNRTNGATDDDCPGLGVPAGWEAFGLPDTNNSDPDAYSCYDLVVDYCGTSPPFYGDSADFLLRNCCDLPSQVTAAYSSTTARIGACCRDEPPGYDGNVAHVFYGVASDPSWYYPVYSVGGSMGDYVLNVTGGAASVANIGDANRDGVKDLVDYAMFRSCMLGPNVPFVSPACACLIDSDADNDVDMRDYSRFQAARTACTSCSGMSEGEPSCAGANDTCATADAVACGQTVCGTVGTNDSDWYQVLVGTNTTLTWTASAEFAARIAIIDGAAGCQTDVAGLVLAEASGGGCAAGPIAVSACVRPGTYWVRVSAQSGQTVLCGSPYKGELTCASCSPTTPVGACCTSGSGGTLTCTANTLESTCEAVGGNYQGNGTSCPCPPAVAGDECLTVISLPQTTGTFGPCTATRTGDNISGTCTFNRSQLTSNASDPLSLCESDAGGPFAKDGSIWFRWRSINTGALHVDTCCGEGGTGDDTVVSIFRRLETAENNTPSVSCPGIFDGGDGGEFACDDDTCVETGVGGADLCRTGTQQGMFGNRDFYILVEIYDTTDEDSERETFTLAYSNVDCNARTCPALPVCETPPADACPPGTDENEPDCVDDYEDITNNGCSPGNPENFQPIVCGQTYCGETANYTSNGLGGPVRRRDHDWFEFTLTEETQLTWTAQIAGTGSGAPGITAQIWRIQGGCDQDPLVEGQQLDNRGGAANDTTCDPVVASALVEAGRYAVTVFGRTVGLNPDPGPQPCTPWYATLECQRGDIQPPPGDACAGAPVVTGAGRYSGYFGALVTQTPDGRSNCDGDGGGDCSFASLDDVYYLYTAPCTGKVSFEVTRGVAPMILSAHTACPATCDNELPGGFGYSCSSFGGGPSGILPKITLDVEAGISYIIRIARGGPDGAYELVISDCIGCCDSLPDPGCPVCGNNIEEGAEECDDGNQTNGDGCDNFCRCDTAPATCGNGLPNGGEQCEDGNALGNDGCQCCRCEITPPGTCGNGTIQAGEQCDDANILCGDGCCCCRIEGL